MQMQYKPIPNEKTLTPNEENIKKLLEDLLILRVNLVKLKSAKPQLVLVTNIFGALRNKRTTFKQIFNMLLFLLKTAQTKEAIAMISKIFHDFQDTYKNVIKEKP